MPSKPRKTQAITDPSDETAAVVTDTKAGHLVPAEFRFPRLPHIDFVDLAGEFNHWDLLPMDDDGNEFVIVVGLQPGRSYRYRYLVNGEMWDNDWSADAYVPNEFGSDDSVKVIADGTGTDDGSDGHH